jgi:hypothetical protein
MRRLSEKAVRSGVLAVCVASGLSIAASAEAAEATLPNLALLSPVAVDAAAADPAEDPIEPVAGDEDAGILDQVDISGEVSIAYLTAIDADSRTLFGRVFDNQAEQFTLHQAEIWFERASSTDSPFGFNIDVVAGDDAEKIHSLGLGESSDSFDLTQAYLSYQVPGVDGLTLKAGKFVTLHGAEVIRRSGNFHYSRALLFGYAIPFTHTGLMATYAASDVVTLTGGIVNGWDNVDDNNEDKTLHAMAGFAPSDTVSFSIGGTYGAEGASSSAKRTLVDAIVTFKPADGLTIMFNYDWAEEEDAAFDGDANWDGLAGYISYDVSDVVSLGARAEYFNDDDGVRLGAGELELWEGTVTARFKLTDSLVASLELRHDESSDGELVFDDFREDTQDTVALELTGSF